jgi:DNA-binding HxlR family transcriptional regulator
VTWVTVLTETRRRVGAVDNLHFHRVAGCVLDEGNESGVEKIKEISAPGAFRDDRYRIESLPMVGGGLDYSAPFQRAIELIGKRWTGAVVKALIPAPARFNQLLAGIPGISDRVLTERLRELETEGLVERLVDPGPPVRVSYRLTSRGRALEPVLAAVADWAEIWLTTPAAAVG